MNIGKKKIPRFKFTTILLTILFIINLIAPTVVYAIDASKVPAFYGDQSDVWHGTEKTEPTKYARDGGFNYPSAADLYGTTVNFPHYRGETSDNKDDYYYCKKKIHGSYRPFYDENIDEEDTSTDIRAHCLTNQLGPIEAKFRPIGALIGNGFRGASIWLFTLVVQLKELNLMDIFDIFTRTPTPNGGKTLIETITEVLLINEDGELSPFMIIFLILWVISMVGVAIKFIKGEGGFEIVKREILYLALATFLFGVAISTNGVNGLSKLSIKLANTINQGITSNDTGDIFFCDYTDDHDQVVNAQRAIFIRANINSSLCSIFDCETIDELTVGSGGLSIPSDLADNAVVTNGGSNTTTNIGYMLWAGQSKVDNTDPISGDDINYMSGGKSNDIYWYIPDVLQESGGMDNNTMIKYADKLNSRTTGAFFCSSFMFLLEAFAFTVAELFAVYVVMVGKVVLTISGLMLLVLPGLFLWEKSRRFAQDVCRTYIGAFIRTVLGNVMFITFLLMFSVLTENNDSISMFIGALLFLIIAIFMPTRIIPSINQMLMEIEGNGLLASKYRQYSEVPLNWAGRKARNIRANAEEKRRRRKAKKREDEEREKDSGDDVRQKNRAMNDMSRLSESGEGEHEEMLDTGGGGSGRESWEDPNIAEERTDLSPTITAAVTGAAAVGPVNAGAVETDGDNNNEEYEAEETINKAKEDKEKKNSNKYDNEEQGAPTAPSDSELNGTRPSTEKLFRAAGIDDPTDSTTLTQAEKTVGSKFAAVNTDLNEDRDFVKLDQDNGENTSSSYTSDRKSLNVKFKNSEPTTVLDPDNSKLTDEQKEFRSPISENGRVSASKDIGNGQAEVTFENSKKIVVNKKNRPGEGPVQTPKPEPKKKPAKTETVADNGKHYGYPDGYFAGSGENKSGGGNKYSSPEGTKKTIKINRKPPE